MSTDDLLACDRINDGAVGVDQGAGYPGDIAAGVNFDFKITDDDFTGVVWVLSWLLSPEEPLSPDPPAVNAAIVNSLTGPASWVAVSLTLTQ